jgi:hypothetical protein
MPGGNSFNNKQVIPAMAARRRAPPLPAPARM